MLHTNVLGETLEIKRTYPDGSFECPFCHCAIIAPATICDNPWCTANPKMPAKSAQEIRAQADAKRDEETRCLRDHEWAMQRIESERQERLAAYRELVNKCEKEGYCLKCANKSDGRKLIRHKSANYHTRS